MDQKKGDQVPAPASHEEPEPHHVMSSEKWERIKAEMAGKQK